MNTIVASDVAVLVRGRGRAPLFGLWCVTTALITALDLLLWLDPELIGEGAAAVPALLLVPLLLAGVTTVHRRRRVMWLQDRQFYFESEWIGTLVDLSGLALVEARNGLLGRPRVLVLHRRGCPEVRIRLDDWTREDLRKLLLALIERPGVRFDRGLHRLLAGPSLAAA